MSYVGRLQNQHDEKTGTAWTVSLLNWHLEIGLGEEWAKLISAKNYRITLKEDWWHSDSHFALPSIIQLQLQRAMPCGERCLQTFHHSPSARGQHCAWNAGGQINSGRFSGRFSFSKNSLRWGNHSMALAHSSVHRQQISPPNALLKLSVALIFLLRLNGARFSAVEGLSLNVSIDQDDFVANGLSAQGGVLQPTQEVRRGCALSGLT